MSETTAKPDRPCLICGEIPHHPDCPNDSQTTKDRGFRARVEEAIIQEINDPRNAVEPEAFRQGLRIARIILNREADPAAPDADSAYSACTWCSADYAALADRIARRWVGCDGAGGVEPCGVAHHQNQHNPICNRMVGMRHNQVDIINKPMSF